jgi:WD40 repeat protein
VQTRRELTTLIGHEWQVYDCAVNPDGSWVVSASGDRTLKVWEVATGRELATLRGHTGQVLFCAFTAAGRRLVSGDEDGFICVWDIRTGRLTAHLPVGSPINCLDAHPLQPRIAFGTSGGDVQLVELRP